MRGQILNYVTALISEQFSKSWLDDLSRANLNKCVLQKVEEFLEPCNAPISNQCPKIWIVGPSFFWSLSQVWFQNSFQNHDPTICLLRNKENIFYGRELVYLTNQRREKFQLVRFGQLWSISGHFGSLLAILGNFGQLRLFGPLWTPLVHFGSLWSLTLWATLIHYGPFQVT